MNIFVLSKDTEIEPNDDDGNDISCVDDDNRDLKHQQRNGTTTTSGSKIFPCEGSVHVRCCQNVI